MTRFLFLVTLVSLALLNGTGSAGDPPAKAEPSKLRIPKEGDVNVNYWGRVTEVTKDSITIEWPGEKPKRFSVSETLAAGKVPMEPRPRVDSPHKYHVMASSMYRLTDVKVGDQITIYYARVAGADICDHVCIHKRPGGLIPPLPEEAEAIRRGPQRPGSIPRLFIPYHEYWNAYWDLEDKGIPFPEKFGYMRRFPVAPMPREVKLGPASTP